MPAPPPETTLTIDPTTMGTLRVVVAWRRRQTVRLWLAARLIGLAVLVSPVPIRGVWEQPDGTTEEL